MIRLGVIGYGYWGPNLVRNFMEAEGSEVVAVCDRSPERLALARKRFPQIETTTDYGDLLKNHQIDAIAIATPVFTHFELAMKALEAGKHVLVEKPIASTSEQARKLRDEAARRNLVLMVDHTFVYSGPVRKVHELIASGEVGDIQYYDSVRINLGLFQHDINVLWDLAVHDLAIMEYLLPLKPRAISATGISHVAGQPENIGYLTLFYDNSLISHIHVNWTSPLKIRRALIGGTKKMIVYDDVEPSERVKVYDKGITVHNDPDSIYQMLISYRAGDVWAPQVDSKEALRTEADHFIDCIENAEEPLTGADAGLRIVQILESASESMRERGRTVELNYE